MKEEYPFKMQVGLDEEYMEKLFKLRSLYGGQMHR